MSDCKKCGAVQGTILLRRKDLYCTDCFNNNINHKFRACIGKNKILARDENVLICLSGGLGSTVLIDLIHNGIILNNHKKLWITPILFHVIDIEEDFTVTSSIIKQCNLYNYDVNVVHISECIARNNRKPILNEIPQRDIEVDKQLKDILKSMPSSSRNDYIAKIKRDLFIVFARELNCHHIFTAETTSTLAVNLISNLCLGRGSQVQHDVGFCDSRNQIKILRPMKDITQEELLHYITVKKLAPVKVQTVQRNSLQSTIQHFINDLQENFHSTISTVCKTAEKIGVQDENAHSAKCAMCESGLTDIQNKLTALEATNYSKTVSMDNQGSTLSNETLSMFPYVNKYLCYACSKNYLEMSPTSVPVHLQNILSSDQ